MTTPRQQTLWRAALVHRLSGLALAVFLPFHFLALGLALRGEGELDGFLKWSDWWLVKLAEMGLVILLTVHLLGGLRILILENSGWSERQSLWAAIAGGASLVAGFAFLIRVW
ncbi:MAG: succinate dehydrogenase, cytochrome b556 subunit [Hyphomicrobiales bacterium]